VALLDSSKLSVLVEALKAIANSASSLQMDLHGELLKLVFAISLYNTGPHLEPLHAALQQLYLNAASTNASFLAPAVRNLVKHFMPPPTPEGNPPPPPHSPHPQALPPPSTPTSRPSKR
jgi:hypothetical protein